MSNHQGIGLTLREAILSGKRFKRYHWDQWCDKNTNNFNAQCVVATDWVLEEEPKYEYVECGISMDGKPLYEKVRI